MLEITIRRVRNGWVVEPTFNGLYIPHTLEVSVYQTIGALTDALPELLKEEPASPVATTQPVDTGHPICGDPNVTCYQGH